MTCALDLRDHHNNEGADVDLGSHDLNQKLNARAN